MEVAEIVYKKAEFIETVMGLISFINSSILLNVLHNLISLVEIK